MQPEISHRCPECGASLGDFDKGALFCPECGKPIAIEKTQETTKPQAESVALEDEIPDKAVSAASPSGPPADADPAGIMSTTPEVAPTTDPAEATRHGARERTRETLHRASSVARGAIQDNVKRVEKIHHVSSVVLEEAHYDPSLRFVLVALGLFIVFIILLVLSKVMG